MASFVYACRLALNSEGGYSNTSTDPGGETYMGISRRWHPGWVGWRFIDERILALKRKPFRGEFGLCPEEHVLAFYREEFWDKLRLSMVMNQKLCNQVFDHAVTSGHEDAIKLLQATVGVGQDGRIGPVTISSVQSALQISSIGVNRVYHRRRVEFYLDLAHRSDVHAANFPSWIARTSKCYAGV